MCKTMLSSLRSAHRLLAALVLIPAMALGQVVQPSPGSQPGPPLDRHAQKVRKTLVAYPSESVVFVAMRDGSQCIGKLGVLSATSFEVVQPSGNRTTIDYANVDRVQKADQVTGNRVVFRRHHGAVYYLVFTAVVTGLILVFAVEAGKS
jgi:hypothetical protein